MKRNKQAATRPEWYVDRVIVYFVWHHEKWRPMLHAAELAAYVDCCIRSTGKHPAVVCRTVEVPEALEAA
jgi:hypothetical protein